MLKKLCVAVAAQAALWAVVVVAASAQTQKKPLDHDVYDVWRRIAGEAVSDDGAWVLYQLEPGDGDGSLRIREIASQREIVVERGDDAAFTEDSRFVIAMVRPKQEDVKQARKAKKKPDEMPKSDLALVSLDEGDGGVAIVVRVKSFRLPEEGAGWVAYLLEKPLEDDAKKQDEAQEEKPSEPEAQQAPEVKSEVKPAAEGEAEDDKPKRKKEEGTTLILRHLATGDETRYERVLSYTFNEPGSRLAFTVSTKVGDGDGVFVVELAAGEAGEPSAVMAGKGDYKSLAFDEAGERLAFLSNRDDFDADQPAFSLYRWNAGWADAKLVAAEGTEGVPQGWVVSEHRAPEFSKSGRHLLFGTAPAPEPEPEEVEETPEDEKVKVDIWSWKDDLLQPQQLVQLEQERRRSSLAVAHLYQSQPDIVVQLADQAVPDVLVGREGDAEIALGSSNLPYRKMISWDTQVFSDLYLIDVNTGAREKVVEQVRAGGGFGPSARLSPDAKFAYWWDLEKRAWFVLDVESRKIRNVSKAIPHPVHNELHDTPSYPGSYGLGGWLEGDEGVLVNDRYDIWLVDPTGSFSPRNMTEGAGRAHDIRFRAIDLDDDEPAIDPREPLLLSAFNETTKDAGFFRDRVRGDARPEKLAMAPKRFGPRFGGPEKAENAAVLLYTREDFREFPDLWVADLDFKGATRISSANPQQAEYLWGDVELIEWTSGDGERLQGLLYKPDNFDADQQYPMMVYFYERNSDNLHQHWAPAPSRSIINIAFYVSRGYVVFIPDIPYKVGYPGESAYSAVVPGVTRVLDMGFVDPERIGVEGHSWGGYQIAYLVTRTDMFAAAEAGAPVSNMTSAYGGIRWGSGLSRMFQYEHTQSRIGGTLWNALHRYMENSPLFFADKVETPLLMMHNDEDGAVPWYQGIEFFVALRRLGKKVWMLNYNGEAHGLTKRHNQKDWAVRMQQFFDHYLKGAPAPVWMVEGVPAIKKGRTLGLELVEEPCASEDGCSER